jgi:hypothetical protein
MTAPSSPTSGDTNATRQALLNRLASVVAAQTWIVLGEHERPPEKDRESDPIGIALENIRGMLISPERKQRDGGRYRIRTYDFHRVRMALYR